MDQIEKDLLRSSAQTHIHSVQTHITEELKKNVDQNLRLEEVIHGAVKGSHDEEYTDIEKVMLSEGKSRIEELNKLYTSPYFSKFILKFDGDSEIKTLFIGKFPFHPDTISSWTTPIARLRYVDPGRFEYLNLNDQPVRGELISKDQFLIVDGNIVFMAVEGVGKARELVHQERLMRKKSDFSLPEIVEQMEKAQDEVIRAHWRGSFLISGPAGSGKTTLALHRVAYLTQAPETENTFPSHSIIVFVQDASTKVYFSNLLPELGIKKVTIVTFDEWIISHLGISNARFLQKYGATEDEKDAYEYYKMRALAALTDRVPEAKVSTSKDLFQVLQEYYTAHFSPAMITLFQKQRKERVLDRFDLSLLGKAVVLQDGALREEKPEYEMLKGMKFKKTMKKVPLNYSLIVVDEAENFLQEQIEILQSCVSKKTKAMLYVGDLAQKTRAYTVEDWNLVGESFGVDRKVVLQKVFRNTHQILEYIRKSGYTVTIPEGVHHGQEVQEYVFKSKSQELEKVEFLISQRNGGLIGILAKTDEYLSAYRTLFSDRSDIKILTINESQGVEFDAVFLVGVQESYFGKSTSLPYSQEISHVNRDLLYVALTRAMNELYVLGQEPLADIVMKLR